MPPDLPSKHRMKRHEGDHRARFLTFSTFQRLPLLTNPAIRDRFLAHLDDTRLRDGFRLYAWVVMPEHVHLLMHPADLPVSQSLTAMKRALAQEAIGRWRDLDAPILSRITRADGRARFWQAGGGYDRNLRSRDECIEKLQYIHNNPVKRGLAPHPSDWRWSSAVWHSGDTSAFPRADPIPW